MTYVAGENAALTLIRTLSDYDANNSISLANDSNDVGKDLLDSGADVSYCILSPGPFGSMYLNVDETATEHTWTTFIDVIEMIATGVSAPEKRLADHRSAIIALLDGYFELNNNAVNYAKVEKASPVKDYGTEEDGILFIVQRLELIWHEVSEVVQND